MTAEQDAYEGTDTPEWNEFRQLFADLPDAPPAEGDDK